MDELVELSKFLSVGLLAGASELAVLQTAVDTAGQLHRACTVNEAVALLVEGLRAGLRQASKLELEVLPAVAFRSAGVAAFFQAEHVPPSPSLAALPSTLHTGVAAASFNDPLAAVRLLTQGTSQANASLSRPTSRSLVVRWLADEVPYGGMGSGSPLPSVTGPSATLLGGVSGSGVEAALPVRQLQRHPTGNASTLPAPAGTFAMARTSARVLPSGNSGGAGGGGPGADFCRASSPALLPPLGGLGSGTPLGGLGSLRVRALTSSMAQTLLVQQLDGAAPVAVAGAGGCGSGAATPSASAAAARVSMSLRGMGSGVVLSTGGPRTSGGSGATPGLLGPKLSGLGRQLSQGQTPCHVQSLGHNSAPGPGPGQAHSQTQAQSQAPGQGLGWAAVVPNVATFLGLSDERQPYKDVIIVQRLLKHTRANSLVMVVSGSVAASPVSFASTSVAAMTSDAATRVLTPCATTATTTLAAATHRSEPSNHGRNSSQGHGERCRRSSHDRVLNSFRGHSSTALPVVQHAQASGAGSHPACEAPAGPFVLPVPDPLNLMAEAEDAGEEDSDAFCNSFEAPGPSASVAAASAALPTIASNIRSGVSVSAGTAGGSVSGVTPVQSSFHGPALPPAAVQSSRRLSYLPCYQGGSMSSAVTQHHPVGSLACMSGLPPATLAFYLVSPESVPRVILEQVAESARQLLQVLHRPFCTALTGPAICAEWGRFVSMVLSSGRGGAQSTAGAGGNMATSITMRHVSPLPTPCARPRSGAAHIHAGHPQTGAPHALQPGSATGAAAAAGPGACGAGSGLGSGTGSGWQMDGAVAGHSAGLAAAAAGMTAQSGNLLFRSTHTRASSDVGEDTGVSVTLDAVTGANTGTLSMMISSIRDALSTVQLDRLPDCRRASQEDIFSLRLLKVIGRGGQGMVFQGQLYNSIVAVKVIPTAEEPDPLPGDAALSSTAVASAATAAPGTPSAAGSAPVFPSGAAGVLSAGAAGLGGGCPAERTPSQSALPDLLKQQQRHKRWLVRDALEVAVTSAISHPHVVQVLNFFTDAVVVEYTNEQGRYRLIPRDDANPTAKGFSNTAIVMEYCDAGTLKHAVDAGIFNLIGPPPPSQAPGLTAAPPSALVNYVALLTSLLEVASGLRHLHEHRLAHCDIKPSNVLLRSCATDTRGWTCKLSDFGCVRLMTDVDPVSGRPVLQCLSPVGSLSYMAPEAMLRDSTLDASIDVYSFGMMMWECAMGQLPHMGVPPTQLPGLVRRGLRPSFHPRIPYDYRSLASQCWTHDPRRRPSAATLVQMLQRMLAAAFDEALMEAQHAQQAYHAAAAASAAAAMAAAQQPLTPHPHSSLGVAGVPTGSPHVGPMQGPGFGIQGPTGSPKTSPRSQPGEAVGGGAAGGFGGIAAAAAAPLVSASASGGTPSAWAPIMGPGPGAGLSQGASHHPIGRFFSGAMSTGSTGVRRELGRSQSHLVQRPAESLPQFPQPGGMLHRPVHMMTPSVTPPVLLHQPQTATQPPPQQQAQPQQPQPQPQAEGQPADPGSHMPSLGVASSGAGALSFAGAAAGAGGAAAELPHSLLLSGQPGSEAAAAALLAQGAPLSRARPRVSSANSYVPPAGATTAATPRIYRSSASAVGYTQVQQGSHAFASSGPAAAGFGAGAGSGAQHAQHATVGPQATAQHGSHSSQLSSGRWSRLRVSSQREIQADGTDGTGLGSHSGHAAELSAGVKASPSSAEPLPPLPSLSEANTS
ncbi:hypothetical protein HYH03_005528 [Edaphochlamys debaryana]|uniref:Protein kinase domain-containing protein n=1 Tax=Edaphochlamys debaryana TaxID=47281 RepID=A0A835YCE8_9CHLO|nr:hypothetical protein HYH03_005528 [Edaphochlamys debaryana]|eukprot:KAG2496295.1 hypothetical protein HYH03_005528 [Edaphochlamys debaryana]